jgi:mono/diheme cytochrome c family protein
MPAKFQKRSWWVVVNWRDHVSDRRLLGAVATLGLAYAGWIACAPSQAELAVQGRELFVHEWTPDDPLSGEGDGLGPVFNATSCIACHSQGGTGGAGDNLHNVVAYETLPNRNDAEVHGGVVHARSIDGIAIETQERIGELFPIVSGGVTVRGVCSVSVADFNPVVFHQINTPALFGSGAIDDISDWSIRTANFSRRTANVAAELGGEFDRTPAGRVRILPDGRVGKFGWKAQFATLEEFVATACAVEVGLSNPYRSQDVPHEHRPDDEAAPDMTSRQLDELVAFCALLEAPGRCVPADAAVAQVVARGEELFTTIGCADCHTPEMGGVEEIYSDFCLHMVASPDRQAGYGESPEVPFPDDLPTPDEWKTPPLWGVADSAPYLHDGSAGTLHSAIEAHDGEARHVTERFRNLSEGDQKAVCEFLGTLRSPDADSAGS